MKHLIFILILFAASFSQAGDGVDAIKQKLALEICPPAKRLNYLRHILKINDAAHEMRVYQYNMRFDQNKGAELAADTAFKQLNAFSLEMVDASIEEVATGENLAVQTLAKICQYLN